MAASLGLLADRVLEQRSYPADDSGLRTPPDFWDAEDLAIRLGTALVFELTVAARIILPLRRLFGLPSGVLRKSTVMLVWIVAEFRVLSRRFNVLNFGVRSLCRPSGLDI